MSVTLPSALALAGIASDLESIEAELTESQLLSLEAATNLIRCLASEQEELEDEQAEARLDELYTEQEKSIPVTKVRALPPGVRELISATSGIKSRLNVGWKRPDGIITGHPAGCPNLAGQIIVTDNFENIIRTPSGKHYIVHAQWFEVTNRIVDTKPAKPKRENAEQTQKASKPRARRGDRTPAENIDLTMYE